LSFVTTSGFTVSEYSIWPTFIITADIFIKFYRCMCRISWWRNESYKNNYCSKVD
jgi:hypothetical protein